MPVGVGAGPSGRVVHRGGVVSTERFFVGRRFGSPSVIRPRAAGLRIGLVHPVYYGGRRVIAHVPRCGFGFFTPVVPVPYPVPVYEPVPVYSSATVVTPAPVYQPEVYVPQPGYVDGGYGYAADGYAGAYGGDYGSAPSYAGVAGEPAVQPPPSPPADYAGYAAQQPGEQLPAEAAPGQAVAPPAEQPADSAAGPEGQPTVAEQQMIEGLEAFTGGDYDKAGRLFLQVAMADSDNIDAWLAYGVARFATGDYEASALAIRRAVRAFPDVVNSPVDLRERYGRLEDFEEQLALLEEQTRNRPEDAHAWLVLGFVQHFSGQREPAGQTFDVIQRRFEDDREIADIFLKAKPLSEIERETGSADAEGQAPGVDESQPPPPPPPPPVGEPPSGDPLGAALESERNLRDSGLAG